MGIDIAQSYASLETSEPVRLIDYLVGHCLLSWESFQMTCSLEWDRLKVGMMMEGGRCNHGLVVGRHNGVL